MERGVMRKRIAFVFAAALCVSACDGDPANNARRWCEAFAEQQAASLRTFTLDDSDSNGARCTFEFAEADR